MLPVMDSRKDTLSPMCGEFLRDPLNILKGPEARAC